MRRSSAPAAAGDLDDLANQAADDALPVELDGLGHHAELVARQGRRREHVDQSERNLHGGTVPIHC
jgi:hypothetical protein